jgi:Na+/H+-dicarboxylate symporter
MVQPGSTMASGDKLVGAGLLTLSASIFVYYTLWVLVLVSCNFRSLSSSMHRSAAAASSSSSSDCGAPAIT